MKCWICGGEATTSKKLKELNDICVDKEHGSRFLGSSVKPEFRRNYCAECFKKMLEQKREEEVQWVTLKHKRMFETAIHKLEHQHIRFEDYEEAIKHVDQYNLNHLDKFDSSEEIMAAIELIQNAIHIKPQYKIGRYQVDFLLDEICIALEIDGHTHKTKKEYDNWRDIDIKNTLGPDWEVVRIPTVLIDKDVKRLVPAIFKVLQYREDKKTGKKL